MKRLLLLVAMSAWICGCASVSQSKRNQVERAQQIGPYSYQRSFEGPGR